MLGLRSESVPELTSLSDLNRGSIPTSIKPDQQFGIMSIRIVDPAALAITMDNKDNQIILSKNKDISLMKDFHIETANQNVIDETDPLRYYLYKEAKCDFKGPA